MKKIVTVLMISALLIIVGCSSDDESIQEQNGKITIVTTISQIGEPLSVIGGDRVNVESLMGPSVDPHLYQATQSDIQKIDNAEIIFYNGLDLEINLVDMFNEISKSSKCDP
mgnify:FL=1